MQSLFYVLIYLLKGSLPWANENKNQMNFRFSSKIDRILYQKANTSIEELCENCPPELISFGKHIVGLRFD